MKMSNEEISDYLICSDEIDGIKDIKCQNFIEKKIYDR